MSIPIHSPSMNKLIFWLDNAQPHFALYSADAGEAGVVSFLMARHGDLLPPLRLGTADVWQRPGAILFSDQALRCTAQALADKLGLPADLRERRVLRIASMRPFACAVLPAPWPTDLYVGAALYSTDTRADSLAPAPRWQGVDGARERFPSGWTEHRTPRPRWWRL